MNCERNYKNCTATAEYLLKSGRKTCKVCMESGEQEDIVGIIKPDGTIKMR